MDESQIWLKIEFKTQFIPPEHSSSLDPTNLGNNFGRSKKGKA